MTGPLDIPRIAEIEERRIAVSLAEIAPESMAWCGGAACRGAPGRWYNSTFGAGLGVTPTGDDVSRLVRFFEERAIEPRAEVSALAGRDVFRAFADAGFVLRSVEDVLVRPLDGALPARERPLGLSIESVDPADERAVKEFAQLTVRGSPGARPRQRRNWSSGARSRGTRASTRSSPASTAHPPRWPRLRCSRTWPASSARRPSRPTSGAASSRP